MIFVLRLGVFNLLEIKNQIKYQIYIQKPDEICFR